jgi:hypothetical protein
MGTKWLYLSTGGPDYSFWRIYGIANFHFALQTYFKQKQRTLILRHQPPGLTVGVNAVAVGAGAGDGDEYDNSAYNLSVTNGIKPLY